MKKFSLGDLWPMLFVTAFGVASIGIPFQILAEREDPIDSVTEAIIAVVPFVMLIPLGIFALYAVAYVVASRLLFHFWWEHLKEGMRKEDVLHILGEPTWKNEDGTDILGARKTTWTYRYRWLAWPNGYQWFAFRANVEFGENDTVTWIDWPTEVHGR